MKPNDYTAVRVGMNATEAIIDGRVDAAIGLENVQMVSRAWLTYPVQDQQLTR